MSARIEKSVTFLIKSKPTNDVGLPASWTGNREYPLRMLTRTKHSYIQLPIELGIHDLQSSHSRVVQNVIGTEDDGILDMGSACARKIVQRQQRLPGEVSLWIRHFWYSVRVLHWESRSHPRVAALQPLYGIEGMILIRLSYITGAYLLPESSQGF